MKRYLFAALVAFLTLGGFLAVAASLGGVTADNLGADSSVVASCDTDGVTTSYTVTYDSTDARDEVTAIVVGGVAAGCVGQTVTVTLTDSGDAVLDTSSAAATSPNTTVNVTPTPPAASAVENVHVVITG
jgi:hypothetical protein